MSINQKFIYKINTIPFQMPAVIFISGHKVSMTFICKDKGTVHRIAKTIKKSSVMDQSTHADDVLFFSYSHQAVCNGGGKET